MTKDTKQIALLSLLVGLSLLILGCLIYQIWNDEPDYLREQANQYYLAR